MVRTLLRVFRALPLPILLLLVATLVAGSVRAQEPGAPAAPADTAGAARPDTAGIAVRDTPPGFPEVVEIEPVVVTVTRAEKEVPKAPRAISVVGAEDVQLGQRTLTIDEALNRVPGTFAQNRNNFSIGERLSIRGFGARAAFGIRGVKIVVDGIPQTLADGQSLSSNIDLASAGRIEVIRGPTSSLYGNAAGGVVDILTEPPPDAPTVSSSFMTGGFDLHKYQLQFAGRSGGLGYLIDGNRLDYDGFRDHSHVESTLANARLTYGPDDRSEWALVLSYNDTPVADSPGSLTRAQADSAPDMANPRSVATAAGESHHQLHGGLSYQRELAEGQSILARAYALDRKLDNPLPFAVIQLERFAGGGGVQYTHGRPLFGFENRLIAGVDLDLQSDDRQNFSVNEENPGEPGDEVLIDQDEHVSALGFYAQNETLLAENVELTLGARYDRVHFEVDDRLLEDGDDSGDRTLDEGAVDILGLGLSPMAGIRFSPTPRLNLYANVATSFQTPTTTELANRPTGAGGFNLDLEPQKATSTELGLKGVLGEEIVYQVAGFMVDVRDELIPFETPDVPERVFFRNAGSSQHNGIEASLTARLLEVLSAELAYTYSNFFFEEFRTAEDTLDGNKIPGVPPHHIFAQLGYHDARDIFALLEAEYVDTYFVDDANTEHNDSYVVVSVRGGWTGEIGGLEWRPFVGINNLFDEEYNGSVVINAAGARFFEPSPGRNAYGGLAVSYRF